MYLKPIGDFFSLLCEDGESKNILQKRFKKDTDSLATLFEIINKIDELGYDEGLDFAFHSRYVDTVSAKGDLGLIEIRVKGNLWRVITYNSKIRKHLVILDAFEHHKHTTMEDMVKRIKPSLSIVRELLEEAM